MCDHISFPGRPYCENGFQKKRIPLYLSAGFSRLCVRKSTKGGHGHEKAHRSRRKGAYGKQPLQKCKIESLSQTLTINFKTESAQNYDKNGFAYPDIMGGVKHLVRSEIMSRNNGTYRQTANDKRRTGREDNYRRNGDVYVYGNTVRKLEPAKRRVEKPVRKQNTEVRKNRDKASHMSARYVLFLVTALCASAYILVNFIQLQSDLVSLTKTVAAKERELNNQKLLNDEEYNRIVNSIDLEEIKRIAIGELGMVYAQEGQIITYENEGRDYMRRVTEKDQ